MKVKEKKMKIDNITSTPNPPNLKFCADIINFPIIRPLYKRPAIFVNTSCFSSTFINKITETFKNMNCSLIIPSYPESEEDPDDGFYGEQVSSFKPQYIAWLHTMYNFSDFVITWIDESFSEYNFLQLGSYLCDKKLVFIGAEANSRYNKISDVIKLARPDLHLFKNMDYMIEGTFKTLTQRLPPPIVEPGVS